MLYDITLRIEYSYDTPAAAGRHILKLMPATLEGTQRLIAGHIEIVPQPAEVFELADFFETRTTNVAFRHIHSDIAYTMQARVERSGDVPVSHDATDLASLAMAISNCRLMGPQSPVHFTGPCLRSPIADEFTDYARSVAPPGASVINIVEAVGAALHRDMRFDAKATTVDTSAIEAFRNRRGVCQDFSHIMISCLRGLGIPAGYVSGYLRTIPPAGQPRLEGADAMHAWVRAWCGPSAGWIEYDPTNAMPAGGDHIVIGYGRDYSDISPVKGVSRLAGGQTTKQSVDVVLLG